MPSKKLKRTRLLLDARTELTDEELKVVFRNLCKFEWIITTNSGCKSKIPTVTAIPEAGDVAEEAREGKWEDYRRNDLGCTKRK